MTRDEQDKNEFEKWIRDCDYHDLDVASMLFVWLASRRLLRRSIQKRSYEFIRAFMDGKMEDKNEDKGN